MVWVVDAMSITIHGLNKLSCLVWLSLRPPPPPPSTLSAALSLSLTLIHTNVL